MEGYKLYVIDNTKKAQDEFGHAWGSDWSQISLKQIEALRQKKQIAFFDGEYSHFISLKSPS